jgi:hypothetical protein
MRSAITFIVVMAIGAAIALLLDRAGLGFTSGFALGVAYMLGMSVGLNTRGHRA